MTKRLAMHIVGILVVIAAVVYVSRQPGHQPPYDANLVRLAESDLQGYCSGDAFMKSEGVGNAGKAAECRDRLAKTRPDKPNLQVVQTAFCEAVVDNGWVGTVTDCLGIMQANEYWPTYDGGITSEWNRARPYPKTFTAPAGSSQGDTSRTGGHDGSSRADNPMRSYYP